MIRGDPSIDDIIDEIRDLNRRIIKISNDINNILRNGMNTDKLIELRRQEAELCKLLKDFIWKVREWDKKTNILGLW